MATSSMKSASTYAPQDISTKLNFLSKESAAMKERPFVNTNDHSERNFTLEEHEVFLRDARPIAHELSLANEGFILARHKLPRVDFRDPNDVIRRYLPEMQEFIQHISGADKVVVCDGPITRFANMAEKHSTQPALYTHTDYGGNSALASIGISRDRFLPQEAADAERDELLRKSFGTEQPEYKRVMSIQTWRTFSEPPHDTELAMCSSSSVEPEDVIIGETKARFLDFDQSSHEFSLYRHNPNQRWFYFPDMEPDEIMVLVGWDFTRPQLCRAQHSAFPNLRNGHLSTGRNSIDVRSFAFFRE